MRQCLPMGPRMTINALVLSLQSPYMELMESEDYPNVLRTLLYAMCDPNDFGQPPKSPLSEATLRNDQEAVKLLLAHRAAINETARGDHFPLITAVKQQRTHMVRYHLEQRADPTVKDYVPTRYPARQPVWVGRTAGEIAEPDTEIARLLQEAASVWHNSHLPTEHRPDEERMATQTPTTMNRAAPYPAI